MCGRVVHGLAVAANISAMAHTVIYMERSIDASHIIPGHPGKCGRLHGHTYRFQVWISGPVSQADGMLIDFFDVKEAIDAWDHRHLNDLVDYIPTAELLAADMQQRLCQLVLSRVDASAETVGCIVRLWETQNAYAQVGELKSEAGDAFHALDSAALAGTR